MYCTMVDMHTAAGSTHFIASASPLLYHVLYNATRAVSSILLMGIL